MTRREARQIAYALAAVLCESHADESIDFNEIEWTDEEREKIHVELADIARRLAYNGRRAKTYKQAV